MLRSDSGLLRATDVGTYIPPGLMPTFSEPDAACEHPFFKDSRFQPTCLKRQDYLAHAFSICFHSGDVDLKAPQLMRDYETILEDANVHLMSDINDVPDVLRMRVLDLPGDIRVDKDVPINKMRSREGKDAVQPCDLVGWAKPTGPRERAARWRAPRAHHVLCGLDGAHAPLSIPRRNCEANHERDAKSESKLQS